MQNQTERANEQSKKITLSANQLKCEWEKKEISERCCYFIIKADFERSKSNENNNSQKHTHPNTTMFEF